MFLNMRACLTAALVVTLVGCAAPGGWRGAEAEKSYDKDLEIQRLASVLNNDDYFELERDGRLYVISDAKDYSTFIKTGELTFSTKKIGAGPGGKTIVYGLIKKETELLTKDPRAQGAAQKLYEGNLQGLDKGFFGVIETAGSYYVFSSWKDIGTYKAAGNANGYKDAGVGPSGKDVIYVAASSRPAETSTRFAKLYQ